MPIHLFCLNISFRASLNKDSFSPGCKNLAVLPCSCLCSTQSFACPAGAFTALYMQNLVKKKVKNHLWQQPPGISVNIIKFPSLWLGLKWRQEWAEAAAGPGKDFPAVLERAESSSCRHWAQEPGPGVLIKTRGFAFSLACVLFEKRLKISALGSTKELH